MLVKFLNTAAAPRVIYDKNSVMRTIAPGASMEIDMEDKVARKYLGYKNKFLMAQLVDDSEEGAAERSLDPKETFTLKQDDERHPASLKEPQTLKEARGLQGNEPPPAVLEEIQKTPAHADAIKANAVNQSQKAEREAEALEQDKEEPTTAAELLPVLDSYSATDQIRLANKVLKKRLPMSAKPGQITAALQAQAEKDAE